MIEALGAGYILKQIKDMVLAVSGLKAADKKAADDIARIDRQLKKHQARIEKGEKVQDSQAREIADLQRQIAGLNGQVDDLNSKNHGLKVSLGKSKAKNARLTKQ